MLNHHPRIECLNAGVDTTVGHHQNSVATSVQVNLDSKSHVPAGSPWDLSHYFQDFSSIATLFDPFSDLPVLAPPFAIPVASGKLGRHPWAMRPAPLPFLSLHSPAFRMGVAQPQAIPMSHGTSTCSAVHALKSAVALLQTSP